jgi:hypothetical protein
MKTLSLLAAAAAALSLSASVTPAATFKPYQGPIAGVPVKPGAVKYIFCTVKSQGGGQIQLAKIYIVNNSGVALSAGTRIYVNALLTNGKVQTTSFVLAKPVANGYGFDHYVYGQLKRCTAQVNLLAKKEPVPKIPTPR